MSGVSAIHIAKMVADRCHAPRGPKDAPARYATILQAAHLGAQQAIEATQVNIEKLERDNARLTKALTKCRSRFFEYADTHLSKGTEDGDAKAKRNNEMVDLIDAALNPHEGEGL